MRTRFRLHQAVLGLLAFCPAGQAGSPEDLRRPWKMHDISRDYLIANSLQPADVDGDGFTDFAVIDEQRGDMTLLLHPGAAGDVRRA